MKDLRNIATEQLIVDADTREGLTKSAQRALDIWMMGRVHQHGTRILLGGGRVLAGYQEGPVTCVRDFVVRSYDCDVGEFTTEWRMTITLHLDLVVESKEVTK